MDACVVDIAEDAKLLAEKIKKRIPPGKRTVFVSGNFNIVHTGHFRLLNFAAECADFLIVGVHDDFFPGALLSQHLRLEGVQALECVDLAIPLPFKPEEFISWLKPDVVIKGKEHEQHFNPEQSIVESYGGKLLFSSGEMRFSSLDLLRQELQDVIFTTIKKPVDYLKRHVINHRKLSDIVQSFSNLSVLVLGDLILDEYVTCDPLGISREDPTIVVTPVKREMFIGGAGIVAAHAKGLGAKVSYFGVVGDDEIAALASGKLKEHEVDGNLFVDKSRPTSLKQRFRAEGKTLLRVSHLRHHTIDIELADEILEKLTHSILNANIVVFSDFSYGCLSPYLVERIIALCSKHGIPMVADSQSSSQIGDITRFHGMLLITPTEHEARLAMRDHSTGLINLAEGLCKKAHATHLFITLGADGLLVYSPSSAQLKTDQLPAFNSSPKDVAGGGDCLFMCASLALIAGADIWESAYLGSLAAAYHVGRIGNSPLRAEDILRELYT